MIAHCIAIWESWHRLGEEVWIIGQVGEPRGPPVASASIGY